MGEDGRPRQPRLVNGGSRRPTRTCFVWDWSVVQADLRYRTAVCPSGAIGAATRLLRLLPPAGIERGSQVHSLPALPFSLHPIRGVG